MFSATLYVRKFACLGNYEIRNLLEFTCWFYFRNLDENMASLQSDFEHEVVRYSVHLYLNICSGGGEWNQQNDSYISS